MNVLGFLPVILLLASANGLRSRPNEEEIFASLVDNLDTTDLLFSCDFHQTHKYVCNVTQQGVPFLKRPKKTSDPKKGLQPEKSSKVAVPSVSGQWSDDDGILKKSYVKLDYLNIVAKCFFRTEYYECFGVPKCKDQPRGMSPCSGGEPWRGTYEGAPNIGFHGNVTSQAMETAGEPPQPDSERMVDSAELPSAYANATGNPDDDQPYDTETPSPTNLNLTRMVPATPTQKSNMIVKEFSNVDNETGVISKGAIAVVPGTNTVMMVNSQTFNKSLPGGGVSVGGSAFSSSRSGSSSGQMADGQGNSLSFDFGNPFSAGASAGSSSSSSSFPRQSLFPSWFQSGNSGFGSLFGDIFAPLVQSAAATPSSYAGPVTVVVRPVVQNLTAPATTSTDPCQGQQFSSALRCMVLDFQRTVTNNILNSLTNSFARFGSSGFGSMTQQQGSGSDNSGSSMFQQQQQSSILGPQSRSLVSPVRTGSVQITTQQQQQPLFGSSFGNFFSGNNNDDWFRFRK